MPVPPPSLVPSPAPAAPSARYHYGDSLAILRSLPADSVDSVVTDPPYALTEIRSQHLTEALTHWLNGTPEGRAFIPRTSSGFMDKTWDAFVPPPAVWDEVLRVLKPGGHLLCFAGARTADLMGTSIRLATCREANGRAISFEVRDSITWAYGSGMPNGQNIGNRHPAWEGWNTSLKPATEPILVARKPLVGSAADNVAAYGTGALHTSACRTEGAGAGRHPANLLLTHSPGCVLAENLQPGPDCQPDCPVARMDAQSGTRKAGGKVAGTEPSYTGAHGIYGIRRRVESTPFTDTGGASRFFNILDPSQDPLATADPFLYQAKATKAERPLAVDATGKTYGHATVKPLPLMRWLCRLVTPTTTPQGARGLVLDPFVGSGTTLEAAYLEGLDSLGIEGDAAHLPLIENRLSRHPGLTALHERTA